ncbi:MAG: nitrilase family protein [Bacteroidales bacterium]|nr:nitrilase family protein [Bacteroidales bacterium]
MKIALCQTSVFWEETERNLNNHQITIDSLFKQNSGIDIIVFPEFFSTGFSIDNKAIAESMNGPSATWLRRVSKDCSVAIMASIPIYEKGRYYNRVFFVTPDNEWHYDKRHLFSYGGENKVFSQGIDRVIVKYKEWNILLQICYDLRFPVWARNRGLEYDLIINVANWPSSRESVVNPLVRARAIENLCYYAFVNRTGSDPQNTYSPIGFISDYKGNQLAPIFRDSDDMWSLYDLNHNDLKRFRDGFRAWKDGDKFVIKSDDESI